MGGADQYHLPPAPRLAIAFCLATLLCIRGIKKRSLSPGGAVAAFFIGLLSLGVSYRFGILLILFYQSSSSITKYKSDVKSKFEDDFKEGGQRNAFQVLACSWLATLLAVVYWAVEGEDAAIDFDHHARRSYLLCAYVGHYACCNGDTWASELGILSESPRLISSFFRRQVPRGTNGGMSTMGTLASLAGGGFIGAGYTIAGLALGIQEAGTTQRIPLHLYMVVVGALCGFLGSILDSLLGAYLQASWFCPERKCIIKSRPAPQEVAKGRVMLVCGRDVLTNEQVNVISVALTTLAGGLLGRVLWGGTPLSL